MANKETTTPDVFGTLVSIDVNAHTEMKAQNGVNLTYLSWPWAWSEVKSRYPDATYCLHFFEGLPYIVDPSLGLLVMTTVTIGGQSHDMWLPVMDGANKAMRLEPYTYKVYDRQTKAWKDKTVAAATMFDINKTIMRCLVKNLAMFGLGLYIYAGEDLPTAPQEDEPAAAQQPVKARAKKAAAQAQPEPELPAKAKKELPKGEDLDRWIEAIALGRKTPNGRTAWQAFVEDFQPSDIYQAALQDKVTDYKINHNLK